MKKIISIILSAIMVASVFTVVPLESMAAKKKVSLKKASATLKITKKNKKNVYGSTTIKVKKVKGVTIKKKTFKSANKKIAKVSSKGKVVAKKKGNTKIKVTVKYKYKKKTYTKKLYFKVKVKDVRKKKVTPKNPVVNPPKPATSEAAPVSSENEPVSSEDEPASSENKPASSEAEPVSSENEPASSEVAPVTSDAEPSSSENQEIIPIESENLDDPIGELNGEATALNTVSAPTGDVYSFSDKNMLKKLSEFSNKLYQMSAENENENYAMSPVSVYMALSMLYSIGDEGVKNDIAQLTKMNDADIAKTGELFNYLSRQYKDYFSDDIIAQLNLTNSIWINNGTETDAATLKALADNFYCNAFETPFGTNNQAANQAVRDFIKKNTNGLIDQDFKLSDATLFALINTLYFKDGWEDNELDTEQRQFKLPNGNVNTDFLVGKYFDGQVQETDCSRYFYTETSHGYKVKFILPKEGYTIKQAMSADNLNIVNQDDDFDAYDEVNNKTHLTRCIFPKFEIQSDTALKTILENNNSLQNAFEEFNSPLYKENSLMVSDIKHKVVFKVDNKGVEGAAVTVIPMSPTSCDPGSLEHHDFVLDSAFGFIVTDSHDVVLFEGQVTNPKQ